jgi:hypothetical protein
MDRKYIAIKLFENQRIRTLWVRENEKWYFSIVDVCGVLSGSNEPRRYWSDLKNKLKTEGSELYDKIVQLKLAAEDGKMRLTDVADTEQILRLIQSIPSKKAEPFKMWLAKVGSERLDEIADPELAFERAKEIYLRKGYSDEWINQRMMSIKVRNRLTDEWNKRGIKKGVEYAILTDEIIKAWLGMTTNDYKQFKCLKKENLRDNMNDLELIITMLGEATTTKISEIKKPIGLKSNKKVANEGGNVANKARIAAEEQIGEPVITNKNAKYFLNKPNEIHVLSDEN